METKNNKKRLTKESLKEIVRKEFDKILKEIHWSGEPRSGVVPKTSKLSPEASELPTQPIFSDEELESLVAALPAMKKVAPMAAREVENTIRRAGRQDLLLTNYE